jgi:pimeloyl-ACP methyl ester carboxylesterase
MKHTYLAILVFLFIVSCDFSKKAYVERNIVFSTIHDSVPLSGTLTLPKTSMEVPGIVLIHGAGPLNRDCQFGRHKIFKGLAEYLSSHGIAVLRYDKRGVGKSKGTYRPFDLHNFTQDGLSGINFLKTIENINARQIGAIGISQGGLIVPQMAALSDDVSFVIMLAGPGVWGRDFFYGSHLEMCKTAGIEVEEIDAMTITFNQFWDIVSKKELNSAEEQKGKQLLMALWNYLDDDSRKVFGYLEKNIDYFFHDVYRSPLRLESYHYDPFDALTQIKCPVLAINGDRDVQVVSELNLPAIERALETGLCEDYTIIELADHNHFFQKCHTVKISDYQEFDYTISDTTKTIIKGWIKSL